ncbi:unnamed protein product [Nippostrongylus brasiliensis]|uniref:Uncharacterized protein n=1 Tax=Nippostrongylus brasiliensis TaxID=27835 RepID=A0A0N4YH00_NIPBR|nr:unnamed protein product [Nippostrongylus brasiliensis]
MRKNSPTYYDKFHEKDYENVDVYDVFGRKATKDLYDIFGNTTIHSTLRRNSVSILRFTSERYPTELATGSLGNGAQPQTQFDKLEGGVVRLLFTTGIATYPRTIVAVHIDMPSSTEEAPPGTSMHVNPVVQEEVEEEVLGLDGPMSYVKNWRSAYDEKNDQYDWRCQQNGFDAVLALVTL